MIHKAQKKMSTGEWNELRDSYLDTFEDNIARELAVEVIQKMPREELRKLFKFKRWVEANGTLDGTHVIFESTIRT